MSQESRSGGLILSLIKDGVQRVFLPSQGHAPPPKECCGRTGEKPVKSDRRRKKLNLKPRAKSLVEEIVFQDCSSAAPAGFTVSTQH